MTSHRAVILALAVALAPTAVITAFIGAKSVAPWLLYFVYCIAFLLAVSIRYRFEDLWPQLRLGWAALVILVLSTGLWRLADYALLGAAAPSATDSVDVAAGWPLLVAGAYVICALLGFSIVPTSRQQEE